MNTNQAKARPLSHDEALRLLEPAVRCRVEVVVTPMGPTDATAWVARVRVKEHVGTFGWVDAATSEPHATASEARGEVVLDYLADVAREGGTIVCGIDVLGAARALFGRGPSGEERGRFFDAIRAHAAAYDAAEADAASTDRACERAGWRAFVLVLVPQLVAEAKAA